LADELLGKYGTRISTLTLIPSSGGVFEIMNNGELIFSKKNLNRFPDDGEIIDLIESN